MFQATMLARMFSVSPIGSFHRQNGIRHYRSPLDCPAGTTLSGMLFRIGRAEDSDDAQLPSNKCVRPALPGVTRANRQVSDPVP